jgi:heme exporter protein A
VSGAPLLKLQDLACIRGGRLLFERISLTLHPGDAVMVLGHNGAGKSSLLRIAAGLLSPSSGEVERAGATAFADDRLALDERLTLGPALGFWARLDGTRHVDGMDAMALTRLAEVPVRMLSTGQRKRAVLARAIASGAPLWLLDEPANGLDVEGQERLAAAMAAHRAGGGAILAASHQPIGLDAAQEVRLAGA